jgi:hypothetical protein
MQDESGTVTAASATTAAAAAESAAVAAVVAEATTAEAAQSAEASAASAAHVEAVVESVGQNVQAAAEQHSEAAITSAVAVIEADLEREQTWMGKQLAALRVELETLKSMMVNQSSSTQTEALARIEAKMESLSLTPVKSEQPPEKPPEGEAAQKVPETPKANSRKKRFKVI